MRAACITAHDICGCIEISLELYRYHICLRRHDFPGVKKLIRLLLAGKSASPGFDWDVALEIGNLVTLMATPGASCDLNRFAYSEIIV
jgi:hypothetical protein